MNRLCLTCIGLCLVMACAPMSSKAPVEPQKSVSAQPWENTAVLDVSADPNQLQPGRSLKPVLTEKALNQGAQEIFNRWLVQRLLFREMESEAAQYKGPPYVRTPDQWTVVRDEVTDIASKKFRLQARFAPSAERKGEIVALEHDRSMVASMDYVRIQGGPWLDQADEAFFLVARPIDREGTEIMRIIGSGRMFHVLNRFAQGKLLETNQEIRIGDVIYPVWMQAEAVSPQVSSPKPWPEQDVEEVVVEPKPDRKQEWTPPAEPK